MWSALALLVMHSTDDGRVPSSNPTRPLVLWPWASHTSTAQFFILFIQLSLYIIYMPCSLEKKSPTELMLVVNKDKWHQRKIYIKKIYIVILYFCMVEPYSVKGFESADMVKILLMLAVLFTQNSKNEEQGKRLAGSQLPMAPTFWAGPLNFSRKKSIP